MSVVWNQELLWHHVLGLVTESTTVRENLEDSENYIPNNITELLTKQYEGHEEFSD